jgi:hypothetical protein
MGETRIVIRLLRIIFHVTGNSAQLCQNFGISGVEHPKHPFRYATACRSPWFSINWMKGASRWFHCSEWYCHLPNHHVHHHRHHWCVVICECLALHNVPDLRSTTDSIRQWAHLFTRVVKSLWNALIKDIWFGFVAGLMCTSRRLLFGTYLSDASLSWEGDIKNRY